MNRRSAIPGDGDQDMLHPHRKGESRQGVFSEQHNYELPTDFYRSQTDLRNKSNASEVRFQIHSQKSQLLYHSQHDHNEDNEDIPHATS